MSRKPLLRSSALPVALMSLVILLSGCSPNQNTITASVYHNMTAHYNGYFYAHEDVAKVEKTILQSLDDDHNQLLRLYPKLDTNLAKSYKADTEEVVKMASISIQRHPNSRWVYKNFILVGLARLYDCDYLNAVQTFKYVNTKSGDADTRHEALVHLIRAFNEKGEFDKAEETIDFLSKEKLSRNNAKQFYLEKAYLYQVQENYDLMVQNLTRADSLLTSADRRARIYFIIGQVYQRLGFGAEAFNYYRKCIATNPDYEIDFYARLNMAQVTRVDDKENARAIRKQFAKMLVDEKNKEFKDKIHFEIAEFELKLGNLKTAMDNYRACLRTGTSKRVQGNGYLRLGQLYFDSLRKFSLAKAYYDSAVNALPPDTEGLPAITKRKEILSEFVEYTGTIELQDSLLRMAAMDTATLRKLADSIQLAAVKPVETKKKKRRFIADESAPEGPTGTFTTRESTTTSDWYFGNLSAVSIGQTEFQRIWGDLKLEDNWRRSVKSAAGPSEIASTGGNAEQKATASTDTPAEAKKDLFTELYAQLPKTDEEKAKSLGLIEEAYFKLGDLYYFRLNEKENAIS
ncbi:MAG: tetratricopeptide repeat protein, partial [Bacteroidota bacterium]